MQTEENPNPKPLKLTPAQALEKCRRWCALQERCHDETRSKLYSWGLKTPDVEAIIAQLISEGFINEERYAVTFAGGKFRMKHWGRLKIKNELQKKKLSESCIRKALASIDDREYLATLQNLYRKKNKEIREKNHWKRKAKLRNFLLSKGYEPELISALMNQQEDFAFTDES